MRRVRDGGTPAGLQSLTFLSSRLSFPPFFLPMQVVDKSDCSVELLQLGKLLARGNAKA